MNIEDLISLLVGKENIEKVKERYSLITALSKTVEEGIFQIRKVNEDKISSASVEEAKFLTVMGILLDICEEHSLNAHDEIIKYISPSIDAAITTIIESDNVNI